MECLLTGATGFLGKVLLWELLVKHPEFSKIHVVVRKKRGKTGKDRFQHMIHTSPIFKALHEEALKRCCVLDRDLTESDSLSELPQAVTVVFNCAASVAFTLPADEAVALNVNPSRTLLAWFQGLGSPDVKKTFVHVSTAYVCPKHDGAEQLVPMAGGWESCLEAPLERFQTDHGHHLNTYTWSKCVCENALHKDAQNLNLANLALRIVRPSIIGPARHTPLRGWVDSASAISGCLLMFGMGALRVVPPTGKLNVIPVDAVVQTIIEALQPDAPFILHATATIELPLSCLPAYVNHGWGMTCGLSAIGGERPHVRCAKNIYFYQMYALLFEDLPLRVMRWFSRSSKIRHQVERILSTRDTVVRPFGASNWEFATALPLCADTNFQGDYLQQLPNFVIQRLLGYDKQIADLNAPSAVPDLIWAMPSHIQLTFLAAVPVIWVWSISLAVVWTLVGIYFFEWAAPQRPGFCLPWRLFGVVLRGVLRNAFSAVQVDALALEGVDWSKPTVICCTHRSYFDFMIVPFMFFHFNMLGVKQMRIVADASFGQIPCLGRFLSACGAIYLDRGKVDPMLKTRLIQALESGGPLLLFPEGTRSRSGQMLPLKKGVFKCLRGTDVQFVPIAIQYDRVFEYKTFQHQVFKKKSIPVPFALMPFMKSCWRLWTSRTALGDVRVSVGPILANGDRICEEIFESLAGLSRIKSL